MALIKDYKKLYELTCNHCGNIFKVPKYRVKEGAKYCSSKCAGEAKSKKNPKVKKTCLHCGETFHIPPSLLKHTTAKFCSRKCWDLFQRKRVVRICQNCEKEFEVTPSALKQSGGKYCSRNCHNKAMTKKEERKCKQCGETFYVWPSTIKKGQGLFCSDKCMRTYQKGENSPHWKGGISAFPYCIKFNNEFKERVREFWSRKCGICEKTETQNNNKKLAVHHVNYDKESCCSKGEPLFIALCNSCHNKTNFRREQWEEILSNYIMIWFNGESYLQKSD
jgi:hypothetical protein